MGGGFGAGQIGGFGATRPGFARGFHVGHHHRGFRPAYGYGYGSYGYGDDGCDIDTPYGRGLPPYCYY
jgi:hypothetical protein